MQGADQHLIGWTEWAYSGQGDITTSASPPGSESLIYNPADPLTGANVNTGNLETLAEPYPQLISGTPDLLLIRERHPPVQLLHRQGRWTGQLPGRFAHHHRDPECRVSGRLPGQRDRRRGAVGFQRRGTGDRLERRGECRQRDGQRAADLAGRRCRARSAMGRSRQSDLTERGGSPTRSVRLVDHDQYRPGAAAARHR